MTLNEVRQKYIDFFKKRGHSEIPSSSLVPENDPTTLFTSSGMQPLIPYLLGEKHPQGNRLVNSQKCFRAEDIDEIGDNRHTTFFEMLGNWSLGDYFKEEQIPWFFEFLTAEIGLDPRRIYVTVFAGDEKTKIPKDDEAVSIWKRLFSEKGIEAKDVYVGSEDEGARGGMKEGRIFYYDTKKNWWSRSGVPDKMPVGEPGGPSSEVFYDFGTEHDSRYGKHCHPNCDCGRFIEIGNCVFMVYVKNDTGGFDTLAKPNVDFGGGLERVAAAKSGQDVFLLDVFESVIKKTEEMSGKRYADAEFTRSFRIIADHFRAAVFLLFDEVLPSNTEHGYFVRRLIRRMVRHLDILGAREGLSALVPSMVTAYGETYPTLQGKQEFIQTEFRKEEERFRKTLEAGLKEFKKLESPVISGTDAFTLFSTYGFPIDMTVELAGEEGKKVDKEGFLKEFQKHQEISRKGAEKKFKGGLADTSEMSLKYHTATHLLNCALRQVLGKEVGQKGSNITAERLRFDFSYPQKMTAEQKEEVEKIVNQKIKENLPVTFCEMSIEEARKKEAIGVFTDKYSDVVKVYSIGDEKTGVVSMELCGGPHVTETGILGNFKIVKEEAVSAGIRRIKAVLG
ncbi:MAG: alanine--tRNA ligase [bacterium]|nr:alanine--tRNA ligase [bacterium]